MRESTTLQATLEEGRAEGRLQARLEGAKAFFVYMAKAKLGAPIPLALDRIEAIDDMAQLNKLCNKFWSLETWEELLSRLEPVSQKVYRRRRT